ncbi:hypothetical protein PRIPAC_87623, partial [Pristionchus pacificus]|uniref:Uncharacterized protein n=1 Tax=Pristionchus pacificus TaxID=54126 RepID=A0A8R1Z9H8_PRIPA
RVQSSWFAVERTETTANAAEVARLATAVKRANAIARLMTPVAWETNVAKTAVGAVTRPEWEQHLESIETNQVTFHSFTPSALCSMFWIIPYLYVRSLY